MNYEVYEDMIMLIIKIATPLSDGQADDFQFNCNH